MKIESKYKIENAASTDSTRLSINGIYFENSQAIATDGRILAIVPCEHTDSEAKHIVKLDDFKLIRKAQSKAEYVEANLNGEIKAVGQKGESYTFQKLDCTFPNYKQVLPAKNRPVNCKIAFDVSLLLKLALALGADKEQATVTLEIEDNLAPIVVRANNQSDSTSYGVLMPVRTK